VLPLIVLSILLVLGVALGFIFFIIPGIILWMMWSVAVPALVVEREGVFRAFGRSAELTKGAKWKIFGLSLVFGVVYLLLQIILSLVGLGTMKATDSGFLSATNLIGGIVMSTIFNVLWGTIQPSLYVELREWKEGGGLENLEQVFA
jgi:uncharacterized membrane protein